MRRVALVITAWLIASLPLGATSTPSIDIATRARGADRVVVAAVERVAAAYERNPFGDELIVSHAEMIVSEVLKGRDNGQGERIVMDVEGGTVGDITLTVSDLPSVARGERAVLFLRQNASGRYTPYMRGLGILKLDTRNNVAGSTVSLDDIRARVRGR
jgi:hypothetical protein